MSPIWENTALDNWSYVYFSKGDKIRISTKGDASVSLVVYCQTIDSNGKEAKAQPEDDKEDDGEEEEEDDSFFENLVEDDDEDENGSTPFSNDFSSFSFSDSDCDDKE